MTPEALLALAERVEAADLLDEAAVYVGRYESENFSNTALDLLFKMRDCAAALRAHASRAASETDHG